MSNLPDRILSECNVNISESISESSALNQFVDTLRSHTKNQTVSLMVMDIEPVIPIFIRRLEAYNLQHNFRWKCDLKSIMKSKIGLTHFVGENFFMSMNMYVKKNLDYPNKI